MGGSVTGEPKSKSKAESRSRLPDRKTREQVQHAQPTAPAGMPLFLAVGQNTLFSAFTYPDQDPNPLYPLNQPLPDV